jgi:hypothetical protein
MRADESADAGRRIKSIVRRRGADGHFHPC